MSSLLPEEMPHCSVPRPTTSHIIKSQPPTTPQAFAVLSEPFSVEGGTLTRTMKPRRAVVFSKYREAVEGVERQLR